MLLLLQILLTNDNPKPIDEFEELSLKKRWNIFSASNSLDLDVLEKTILLE